MNAQQLSKLIPREQRKEIIDLDLIHKARADMADQRMNYLVTVWKEFIRPDFDPACNRCMASVLKNFKNMRSYLLELEVQDKLLDAL